MEAAFARFRRSNLRSISVSRFKNLVTPAEHARVRGSMSTHPQQAREDRMFVMMFVFVLSILGSILFADHQPRIALAVGVIALLLAFWFQCVEYQTRRKDKRRLRRRR